MTLRDDVWDATLRQLQEEGSFVISDLPFDESQRHTVRRVLREMEDRDWLTRENKQQKTWYAGKTANNLLQLSMRAKVAAGFDNDE